MCARLHNNLPKISTSYPWNLCIYCMPKGTLQICSVKDLEMESCPDYLGGSVESRRVLIRRMHRVRVREGDITTEAENQ